MFSHLHEIRSKIFTNYLHSFIYKYLIWTYDLVHILSSNCSWQGHENTGEYKFKCEKIGDYSTHNRNKTDAVMYN